jgi:hypothetical protein
MRVPKLRSVQARLSWDMPRLPTHIWPAIAHRAAPPLDAHSRLSSDIVSHIVDAVRIRV